MPKRVTLRQIGKRAGVSDVAVGAALGLLSEKSSVRLSPKKAELIRRVADEMGYQPNLLARAFRQQQTGVVGVLFRVVSNPLSVSYLIDCIHRELLRQDLQVNLSPYQSRFEVLHAGVQKMVAWRVDGLILCHVFQNDDPDGRFAELEQMLDAARVPLVLVESSIATARPRCRVQVDLEQATFDAAVHLLESGHRRLAYVGDRSGAFGRRWNGVQRAVAGRPGAAAEHLVLDVDGGAPAIQQLMLAAIAAGRRIATMPDRPTGLVCNNDQIAVGVIAGLRDAGVHLPRDCSVTGYDHSDLSILSRPPLTTFQPPIEQIAQRAVAMMMAQLDEPSRQAEQEVLRASIVAGGSTAAAP